ncbi:hypothetical protein ACIOUE_00680 [Streptomyces xanthochromogenes]|uniref:hypothetical protein n=1 Tax=Streptomyces xanthochromogenes TaxID=67384 RepID=UPI0037F31568
MSSNLTDSPVSEPLGSLASAALERLGWAFAPRVMTPGVLRLRSAMRAADYNPDLPHQVEALATVVTIDTRYLKAVLTGRAPLDLGRLRSGRLSEVLGVSVPSMTASTTGGLS